MACTSRPLLVAAALAAGACSAERELPPPLPTGIEPAIAYAGAEVPVVIRGEAFYARGSHRTDGSGGDLSTEFLAWLGTTQLREVTWLDTATLTAVVPVALGAGTHDLVVEGPYGTQGVLAAAYVALDGGTAPVLTVYPEAVPTTALVGDPAQIHVRVKNWGPGAVNAVKLLLKRVVDGVASDNVPGGPPIQALAAGTFFDAVYPVTTSAPGAFDFQAKASGIAAATNAYVTSEKGYVQLEVVAPP
jgi:hypothetical protein